MVMGKDLVMFQLGPDITLVTTGSKLRRGDLDEFDEGHQFHTHKHCLTSALFSVCDIVYGVVQFLFQCSLG